MRSPRTLIIISVFLLLASTVFGVLNSTKIKALHAQVATAVTGKRTAQHDRMEAEKDITTREAELAERASKVGDSETHIASAEAELVKSQTEKSDLLSKLQAKEGQIADLEKRLDETTKTTANPNPGAPSVAELQAQLDEARKQIDAAEDEKTILADKFQSGRAPSRGADVAIKRREPSFRGSVRGTVLAVNHAYNFVVLNLGGRQGVEANAEMLVLRGGSMIGKIRISSVEPATAIGDIVGNSLARGVQVQPGDTVVYAGPNS